MEVFGKFFPGGEPACTGFLGGAGKFRIPGPLVAPLGAGILPAGLAGPFLMSSSSESEADDDDEELPELESIIFFAARGFAWPAE